MFYFLLSSFWPFLCLRWPKFQIKQILMVLQKTKSRKAGINSTFYEFINFNSGITDLLPHYG